MSYNPLEAHQLFGAVGNLGENLNDEIEINAQGYSCINVLITVPPGGEVSWEGLTDDNPANYRGFTMRSQDLDTLVGTASQDQVAYGSISGFRKIRFVTTSAGSSAGSVIGTMMTFPAVQELIEFGAAPHRFGFDPVHKDFSFSTSQSGTAIWTPASGKRFVVTDVDLFASGTTDALVSVFDETDASGNRLFRANIDVSNNNGAIYSRSYKTPYLSVAADNELKITTDANIDIDGVLHGYEI